jgi:glutaredoxin 3
LFGFADFPWTHIAALTRKDFIMPAITVYSGPGCPFCERAKMLLKKKGAAFEDINVKADPAKLEEMSQKSQGRKTIPQIFIGDKHIGGCDDLYALDAEGKLDALLAG